MPAVAPDASRGRMAAQTPCPLSAADSPRPSGHSPPGPGNAFTKTLFIMSLLRH